MEVASGRLEKQWVFEQKMIMLRGPFLALFLGCLFGAELELFWMPLGASGSLWGSPLVQFGMPGRPFLEGSD